MHPAGLHESSRPSGQPLYHYVNREIYELRPLPCREAADCSTSSPPDPIHRFDFKIFLIEKSSTIFATRFENFVCNKFLGGFNVFKYRLFEALLALLYELANLILCKATLKTAFIFVSILGRYFYSYVRKLNAF